MKRLNTKVSKRIVAIILASVAAVSVMGCSAEKTVTTTETHTEENGNTITTTQTVDENGNVQNETTKIEAESAEATDLITYEFETFDNVKVVIDENNIVAQESSEDPEHSALVSAEAAGNIIAPGRDFIYLEDADYYYVADISRNLITVADKSKSTVVSSNDEELPDNPGFFETDLWSISYDTDKWYGYVDDEGAIVINYVNAVAGTSLIEITEMDVATASEALEILEEKKGKELVVIDDIQTSDEYSCFAYAEDEVYESGLYIADFYTIYEHNGKVIVLDEAVTHDDDDARAEALAEEFVEVKNTLVLK